MNQLSLTSVPAAAAFDGVAHSYDETFTESMIGRAQRKQVCARLIAAFAPGDRILELNCGTGEDARFLARRGCAVLACDASAAMIDVARRRGQRETGLREPHFLQLANEDLDLLPRGPLFDGVFSNFSGLNCVADLAPVVTNLAELVRPGGNVLLCIWSRVCASELLWYTARGQFKKATRRVSGRAIARIGDGTFSVSYPTVAQMKRAFAARFQLRSWRAIGLFVPPSYVEPWIRKHRQILLAMKQLDDFCAGLPLFRGIGDHVLLEFTRCK